MKVRCAVCDEPIDLELSLYYTDVSGWEIRRKHGGTNMLYLRKPGNRFMCEPCMLKARRGMLGQLALE